MRHLLIVFLIGSIASIKAQRYFPNFVSIQARAGVVDGFHLKKEDKQAYQFGLSVATYTQNGNQWVLGVEYLKKNHAYKDIFIPIEQYTLDAGYYYTLFYDNSHTFYFSGGLSGVAGYEQVNRNKKLLFDGSSITNEDKMIGGVALTLELEAFLTDQFILTLTARDRYLMGSTTGRNHFILSAGIRIVIN